MRPAASELQRELAAEGVDFLADFRDKPGQRVFDIQLQGKTVAKDFDPVAKAGGAARAFVTEFHDIPVAGNLVLELAAPQTADPAHQPLLSGIELLRTNAKEITDGVTGR